MSDWESGEENFCCLVLLSCTLKLILIFQGRSRRFKGVFPPMGSLLAWLDMNHLFQLIDKMGEEVFLGCSVAALYYYATTCMQGLHEKKWIEV